MPLLRTATQQDQFDQTPKILQTQPIDPEQEGIPFINEGERLTWTWKCRSRPGGQMSTTPPNVTEDMQPYGRIRKRMHYKSTPTVIYLVRI